MKYNQYSNYFSNEVIPLIEENFYVDHKRFRAGIGGIEMGGYGSMYLGLD